MTATPGNTHVTISWIEPGESDFVKVEITANPDIGTITVLKGTTSFNITELTNDTEYTFTVKTVDTNGNKSVGETLVATPLETPPQVEVTALTATPGDTHVTISWIEPSDSDFVKVEITANPDIGTITVLKGTTSFNITELTNDTEYTFTVKTVDTNGNKSVGETVVATPSSPWTFATLDSTGDVGHYTSIDIDSSGSVHISYYDATNGDLGALKYATNKSGSWIYVTIDSTEYYVGLFTSIAIDSNDKVHISYYYSSGPTTSRELKYATNESGSWVYDTIDSIGSVGEYTSIAIDSNDAVHISYFDGTYIDDLNLDLKYATNKSGSWVTDTLDSTGIVGWYTSIAIDSNDAVHISFHDRSNYDLKYATNKSGSWVYDTLDSTGSVGHYTSIAIDSNDSAHISYNDAINTDLKYATNKSGSWVTAALADAAELVGWQTSIAIDSNDTVHISYQDYIMDDLKYATNKSGLWVYETIDASLGMVGNYNSIAIDSNDSVHISYVEHAPNYDLKYATTQ